MGTAAMVPVCINLYIDRRVCYLSIRNVVHR